MEIKLIRKYRKAKYSIGKLYIDGKYFCDTMEDKDRDLVNTMSTIQIQANKVMHETAIPYGKYVISLGTKSPKYSDFNKYKWAKETLGYIPRLIGVRGFEGVLIHPGNTLDDSSGCILVGYNKAVGKVIDSVNTFKKLYTELLKASNKGERITIEICKY